MKKVSVFIGVLLLAFQVRVHADEGMWLLSLLEQMNMDEMSELGLELTSGQIYSINHASLKDAVGALDGGSCTAELISSEGLLLTNHHCGYDEIQYHSTVEIDYLRYGFWAMTREEELPNEGKRISFLVRMEEVTGRILPELNDGMTEEERYSKIRSLSGMITSEATEGTHYEANVRSMYGGNRFFLFVSETFLDVRLVGAPPESIGKFGGDTDNWVWPRHTGDFSLFRVYTGPDGKPAGYSPDNIPMKPKHYLPVSLEGYRKDDFAMVLGYPGSTDRFITSWEVRELLEVTHPNRIRIRGIKQEIQMADMLADPKVRIQYASKYSRSSNYWKYSIGQSNGLTNLGVVEEKQAQEEAFMKWVRKDPRRVEEYGDALEAIRNAIQGRRELQNAFQYHLEAVYQGMESVYFARNLREMESMLAISETNPAEVAVVVQAIREMSEDFYKDYHPQTDRKVMTSMIRLMMEDMEDEYLPPFIAGIKTRYNGDVEKYVDRYFKKSFVVDQSRFNAFLDGPTLKVLRKDPAYQAMIASQSLFEIRAKLAEFDAPYARGSRLYLKGLMEMYPNKDFYPDANSTMRLTYGTVGDYLARDAVLYKHFTTLKGVMEKEVPGDPEFDVPGKLKDLYLEGDFGPYGNDGQLPVCFTTNNDITGGNSGSPVINGEGELIGLAFDGNWEAMSGDVDFEPDLQKCINVDIRYVLFIIDKFAGAGHLVEEMKLVF